MTQVMGPPALLWAGLVFLFVAAGSFLGVGPTYAQNIPGAQISNTATATFNAGARVDISQNSNQLDLTVVPASTPGAVEFMIFSPGNRTSLAVPIIRTMYSSSGTTSGPFLPLAEPTSLAGIAIDISQPVPLESAAVFFQGDPLFLRVVDLDQNRDAQVRETILLELTNGELLEQELLRLTETGPDTGEFLGFIQSNATDNPQAKDGVLSVRQNQAVTASYSDVYDNSDFADSSALFDPIGRVFDSVTGQPVDGATVRLVDANTGAQAQVTGVDGLSSFPAIVITGQTVSDANGTEYDFGSGGYRFPHVPDGLYRIEVDLPAAYRAPTRHSDAALQGLPGGPFALVNPGSRGEDFFIVGQPLQIDVPVDKVDTDLFISKTAGKSQAAVGDFVPYEIRVENATTNDATDLLVTDSLPLGFRYQPGSTLMDGQPAEDPAISRDGRTLIFSRLGLNQGANFTIRYVLGVIPGAPVGKAVNRARAQWAQVQSHEATAVVTVRRDLFGDTNTIVGRVTGRDCQQDSAAQGIAGIRVYLESGAFAVTDEQGRYHIAGINPGAHVVQMDLTSLPADYVAGDCSTDQKTQRLLNEHPWSHLVDLQGGTVWRSDFKLQRVPPSKGQLTLALDTQLLGDQITGTVTIDNQEVSLRQTRLTVVLPEATSYVPGSARIGDRSLLDPSDDQGTLVFRLGEFEANEKTVLVFQAQVKPPLIRANLTLKSMLMCDSPTQKNLRTEVVRTVINLVPEVQREERPEIVLRPRFASLSAELNTTDIAQIDTLLANLLDPNNLEIVAVKVIGHTDSQRIRPGAHPIHTDNHALSLARAEAVGRHISQSLQLNEAQLSMYGMGAREPLDDNSTAEGRALNRRVTLQIWTEKIDHLLPLDPVRDHERVSLEVTGFRPGETWPANINGANTPTTMPNFDANWLASAPSGERILWPPHGHLPHLPSLKLAVQHSVADSLLLKINGVSIGRKNFNGRVVGADTSGAVSSWAGLDLELGDNLVTVDFINQRGLLVQHLERLVHYSGPPVFVEFLPERSRLIADGKTIPTIALRLTDEAGYPARRDVIGKFSVVAPHEAWRAKSETERESISELQDRLPTYTIGADGVAILRLAPTTSSGEALINLRLHEQDEEVRAWLKPAARDWILAGVVSGTVGYNTVAGNLEDLNDPDSEEGLYSDGRVAFFAKGRLKGKWLLTLAYDSRENQRDALFGEIDPDEYYTVYGDAVVQRHDAPTSDHLYIRMERDQFYALYGDYNTGLTVTELSQYNRALSGMRSGLRHEKYGYDVFASESHQNFRRDEIPGDGTSGLYRLSQAPIVPHSERLVIQVRDRYRSEIIVSERHLVRSVDYTLDELDGTLFFKEPVLSQDHDFNPVWIVAEYETESAEAKEVTGGGRGFLRPHENLELGLTGVRQGVQGGKGDVLAGLDTRWDLTKSLRLKAEYATSDTQTKGRHDAWFGEMSQRAGPINGRLYYRNQAPGFGLGQLNKSESGARKFGADLRWEQHAHWRVDATAFDQTNLINDSERLFGEIKLAHNSRRVTASVGLRAANDTDTSSLTEQSRQVTADASLKFWQDRGRVRIGREQAIAGQDDIADFPTRTSFGLEYEVLRHQKIFLAQEIIDSQGPTTNRTRLGVESVPWTGARITSSAEQRRRENDRRVFANVGLKQALRIDDRWQLDGSVDHGQSANNTPTANDPTNPPMATSTEDGFTAGSLGATFRSGLWLVDQRVEFRTSDTSEKWGLSGGVHVEPGRDLGLLASLRMLRTKYRLLGHHYLSDISLGMAWRPSDRPWLILDRLSYRTEDKSGGQFGLSNWRVVNNLNVLRTIGERDQVSTLIGARYNRDTIEQQQYESFTSNLGLEWRHFFGHRWDLGLRGSSRHDWQAGIVDYSAGLSAGYRILEDIWLSLGYNIAGYHDRDFSALDHTVQGPYLRFRVRLNQEVTREMLR